MPSIDRRQYIRAAGLTLAGSLSGCLGSTSESMSGSTSTDPSTVPGTEAMAAHRSIRADTDQPVIYDGDRSLQARVLTLSDALADVQITAATDQIRSFVRETEFETQSILLEQRVIPDCYERTLVGLRAEPDEIRVWYCRSMKAPTTACEADTDRMEVLLTRIDREYETRPSGIGASERQGCEQFETTGER